MPPLLLRPLPAELRAAEEELPLRLEEYPLLLRLEEPRLLELRAALPAPASLSPLLRVPVESRVRLFEALPLPLPLE